MPKSVAGKKKMGYWYTFLRFWETGVTFLAPLSQEPIAYLEGGKVLNVTTTRLWVLFMLPAKSKEAKRKQKENLTPTIIIKALNSGSPVPCSYNLYHISFQDSGVAD